MMMMMMMMMKLVISCSIHCCYALLTFSAEITETCCWKSVLLQVDGTLHDALTPVTLDTFVCVHLSSLGHIVDLFHLISCTSYLLYLTITYCGCHLVDYDLPKLWRCMSQSLGDNCCVKGAIHKIVDSEDPVAARGDHHIFTLTFIEIIETQGCSTDSTGKQKGATVQTRLFLSDLQG